MIDHATARSPLSERGPCSRRAPDSPNHPRRAGKFEQCEMEIYEAFEALGDYVDSADPDVEFPNVR